MFGFLKKKVDEFASKITKTAEEKIEDETEEVQPTKEPVAPKTISKKTPIPKLPVSKPPILKSPKPKAVPPPPPKPAAVKELPKAKEQPMPPKKEKLSLATRLKRVVISEVSLSEKEIDEFLWEFELALLESDVAQPVAEELITEIKTRLIEAKFSKKQDIQTEIKNIVRDSIRTIISFPSFDLLEKVKSGDKPFVIMFLGPNGAGKTTTLAKIAHMLKKEKIQTIFSASDTFRAASIEQLEHHATKLGVRVIKHTYGADPAAVAFDAIKSAKAKGIDCVLIDTAGRQETNKNLMEELKKIKRVANPNLIIYLDEALAGNVLVERVNQFKTEIGVDGVILSKMDMDVKGGGTISIARTTGVPILYYGTGQSYDDLIKFDADQLLERLFG